MKRIILNVGEFAVSKKPATLETILGSCVAVCLWDANRRIGGLNHYLLPFEQPGTPLSNIYGATSIDAMVHQVINTGADINSLQAQIFGGGSVLIPSEDVFNVGMENIRIARKKLHEYDIPVIGERVGATHGIRVVFKTYTGEVTIRPLGEMPYHNSAAENIIRRTAQPCKKCIICGSCKDLPKREGIGQKIHK